MQNRVSKFEFKGVEVSTGGGVEIWLKFQPNFDHGGRNLVEISTKLRHMRVEMC